VVVEPVRQILIAIMQPHQTGSFEPSEAWSRAREPVFWLDGALAITWVNPAWERLTGYQAQTVIGTTCHAHGPSRSSDTGELAASFYPPSEALAGQPRATPTLILHASGARLWHRIEFWPFCDHEATLIGVLGVVRPIGDDQSAPDSHADRLHVELLELRRQLHERFGFDSVIGSGPAHSRLLEQVRLASATTLPVLIVGEIGTGKYHVARAIHHNRPDREHPLLTFDCEALPPEVFERELFGAGTDDAALYDRTAPARGRSQERPVLKDGATVLLREIFKLPRDLQLRLVSSLKSSVRLVATTTLDPDTALETDQVRRELYFALTTLVLRLSPLRQRRDELPALAQHFLERANARGGQQRTGFSTQAVSALTEYDWPGNLPELARVIDYAHGHPQSVGPIVELDALPASMRGSLGGAFQPPRPLCAVRPLDELLAEIERRLIENALRQARQNKSRAADLLGISRPRLYRRIKELGLPDDSPEGPVSSD
jgi:DNA-binding NtrC family response regulator